jgi:aminoglycoside phosphotransferase (APT) family kinase protein
MPEWDPEVTVDAALVRGLLADQFPELDASSACLLGEGWDNSVWAVEDTWAFRFPRRAIAIPGVEREIAVLPRLAPLLPAPIPTPTFVGVPGDRFPWPFFGAPILGGVEPADAGLTDDDRIALGGVLGAFLRVLHAPETLDSVDPERTLPVDFNRRADMQIRVARVRDRLRRLPADVWRPPGSVECLLRDAEALEPTNLATLVHGDCHYRHVLVDGGSVSGVIDWGDVCRAEPAVDLMILWLLLPPDGRRDFVAAYGPIDDARLLRARVLALFLGVALGLYARDVGNARLERESVAALDRTLTDY